MSNETTMTTLALKELRQENADLRARLATAEQRRLFYRSMLNLAVPQLRTGGFPETAKNIVDELESSLEELEPKDDAFGTEAVDMGAPADADHERIERVDRQIAELWRTVMDAPNRSEMTALHDKLTKRIAELEGEQEERYRHVYDRLRLDADRDDGHDARLDAFAAKIRTIFGTMEQNKIVFEEWAEKIDHNMEMIEKNGKKTDNAIEAILIGLGVNVNAYGDPPVMNREQIIAALEATPGAPVQPVVTDEMVNAAYETIPKNAPYGGAHDDPEYVRGLKERLRIQLEAALAVAAKGKTE